MSQPSDPGVMGVLSCTQRVLEVYVRLPIGWVSYYVILAKSKNLPTPETLRRKLVKNGECRSR